MSHNGIPPGWVYNDNIGWYNPAVIAGPHSAAPPDPAFTVTAEPLAPEQYPCPHGRPSWRSCPHCLGIAFARHPCTPEDVAPLPPCPSALPPCPTPASHAAELDRWATWLREVGELPALTGEEIGALAAAMEAGAVALRGRP